MCILSLYMWLIIVKAESAELVEDVLSHLSTSASIGAGYLISPLLQYHINQSPIL